MERAQRVESMKDMDQKELEEELSRLREEAVKAFSALRVAQERLHEVDHRLAKLAEGRDLRPAHHGGPRSC